MISDLIKKQMVMLGPNLVLSRARKIKGLEIADSGEVLQIQGDPAQVLRDLSESFSELSGHISRESLARILDKYPQVKGHAGIST